MHKSSATSIDFAGNMKIYLGGGGSSCSGDGNSGRFIPLSSSSSSSSVESEENSNDTSISSLSLSSNVLNSPCRSRKKKVLLEIPEELEKLGTGAEHNSDESNNNHGLMNLDLDIDNYMLSVYHMKDDDCASTAAASLCNTSFSSSSSCSSTSTTSLRRRHRGAASNRKRKERTIDHPIMDNTDHNNNNNSWIDSMRSVSSSMNTMTMNMSIFDVEGEEEAEKNSWTPLKGWNTTPTTIQDKNMNMVWDSNPEDDYWSKNDNPLFDRIKVHEEQSEI